nr:MAG TPA: hypothetical protein [Caudoviricetes sp.]DAN45575.1 MAG TPA: hypothetical protein [Caudoviricetes sp.]DAO67834.1 MAG TPA: hypothetical protein [Caudoviricetes sp.]DAR81301.1 MAG TPA: hypothetical protein [Caudoviricetes sp.]
MINWKLAYLILICLPFSSRRIPDAESRAEPYQLGFLFYKFRR